MLSHYQSILDFNKSFEVQVYEGNLYDVFENNSDLINFRLSLIVEEVSELKEAVETSDVKETIDALIDILYVAYGAFSVLKIDADKKLNITKYENIDKNYVIFNNIKVVDNNLQLININMQHLIYHIMSKDVTSMVHTLLALTQNVYKTLGEFNIDVDAAFNIVHKSNMSKLCVSETEAIKTVESYKTDKRYDTPAYRESKNPGKWIVYNKSTSKILKNINYVPADFSSIMF
jgi:predicted HAD superfamily Cof-like phosphohydrolase